MRQLLGRKSRQKLGPLEEEHDTPRTSTPGVFGERVFPVRNGMIRSTADVLPPIAKTESINFDDVRSDQATFPTSRISGGHPPNPESSNTFAPAHSDQPRKTAETSQYIFSSSGPPQVQLLLRCEDEPIHTPGAIQSFGALLGLKYSQDGRLEVRIASENSRKIIGYGPEQLFALTSFLDVLKQDVRDEMVARIEHILSDTDALTKETRLDVFQMTITFPYEPETRLWCAMHLAPNPQGLVICEFEEYSDAFYLKDADQSKILPVNRVHHLGFENDPPEELEKSTTRASKPLQVIKIARQKEDKEFSSMDLFKAMTQAQNQIVACDSVQRVLEIVVGIIAEITGFHRVMFYRFDAQMNGCVDAEILNPQASSDVYRGLHYPASDIPKQARELYKINRIRVLHDRDAITAKLVCRAESDMEQPLDLTHSYLRALSPIHNKYLSNMGVRSTMSISIVINDNLWGLVACHGYGDIGTRVSLPIRELCRNIGECAAVNIQRMNMQQRIEARRIPTPSPSTQNPNGFVANSSADLLRLVDADFALFSIDDEARAVGRLEPYQEAVAIMSYLQSCKFTTIRSSHNITADFPGLSFPAGLKSIAGLLFIPLNAGEGNNFLVFFRKGQEKQVKWAGNPHQKKFRSGTTGYLEPRMSFQRWSEKIVGNSKEWTDDQLDTASILGLLYGRSIDAWRQKSSGSQSSGEPDDVTIHTIETFNLSLTAARVMKTLQKEAERKSLDLTTSIQDQLPAMVKGDGNLFKQVLVYFTSNAFKDSTSVKVDINLTRTKDEISVVGITVEDTGPGMSEEQLDDVFQEFEQAQEAGWPLPSNESTPSLADTNPDLPAIARYVRNVNGQVLVTSDLGRGTTFSVELPFEHAPSDISKPRKFRNLFLPSSGPPKGIPPSAPPVTKPPTQRRLNGTQTSVEPPAHTQVNTQAFPGPPMAPSPRSSSLHSHLIDRSSSVRAGVHDHALNRHNGSNIRSDTPPLSPNLNKDLQTASIQLNILIAEDDPICLRMLEEKVSLLGHKVDVASNGQECHSKFASNPLKYDIILMDLEMPIVDGGLSTRMIRFLEKESKRDNKQRVPIIALSASFDEDSRMDYISNGFDGWIPKPIDFRGLDAVLQGVKKPKSRRDALYCPGEKGGWFLP